MATDIGVVPVDGAIVGGGRCHSSEGSDVYINTGLSYNAGVFKSGRFYISDLAGHTLGDNFRVDQIGWQDNVRTLTFVGTLHWRGADVPCTVAATDKPGHEDALTVTVGTPTPVSIGGRYTGYLDVLVDL